MLSVIGWLCNNCDRPFHAKQLYNLTYRLEIYQNAQSFDFSKD